LNILLWLYTVPDEGRAGPVAFRNRGALNFKKYLNTC